MQGRSIHTPTNKSLERGSMYATVVAVPTAIRNESSRCLYKDTGKEEHHNNE